jgi:hypothetical protein
MLIRVAGPLERGTITTGLVVGAVLGGIVVAWDVAGTVSFVGWVAGAPNGAVVGVTGVGVACRAIIAGGSIVIATADPRRIKARVILRRVNFCLSTACSNSVVLLL